MPCILYIKHLCLPKCVCVGVHVCVYCDSNAVSKHPAHAYTGDMCVCVCVFGAISIQRFFVPSRWLFFRLCVYFWDFVYMFIATDTVIVCEKCMSSDVPGIRDETACVLFGHALVHTTSAFVYLCVNNECSRKNPCE